MLPNISGSTQRYLADLAQTEAQMQQAQSQVSSGLKVQKPSDSPATIAEILQIKANVGQNQQVQSNLAGAGAELSIGDTALQSAVQSVQTAISLAAQGANSIVSASERANIAQQVSGLQQALVGISQTAVNGRYIFSGDQDSQPAYQLDPSQPNGVKQMISGPSTRVIQDAGGTSIAIAKTAQEIFDPRNADGSAAAGSVFAAINSLITSLQNNDQTGISQAAASLQTANSYLNGQLQFYGEAEDRVSNATSLAQRFQTQEQADLSQLQDADIPTVALQLSQLQVQQQATLSVAARIEQNKNLFSYLG